MSVTERIQLPEVELSFDGANFRRTVEKVAIVTKERAFDKPFFESVRLVANGNSLELTACDGLRVAKAKAAILGLDANYKEAIVNARHILSQTGLLFPSGQRSVAILGFYDDHICLRSKAAKSVRVEIPFIDTNGVKYPDIDMVFPKTVEHSLRLSRENLSRIVGKLDKRNDSYIILKPDGTEIKIFAFEPREPNGKCVGNLHSFGEPLPFDVAIFTSQIGQIVRSNFDAKSLTMELKGPEDHLVFRSDTDPSYVCLVTHLKK